MSLSSAARNVRDRGPRGALAVTVLAWLGILAQPCVMAAAPAETTAPDGNIALFVVAHHGVAHSGSSKQCLHCADPGSASDTPSTGCEDLVASGPTPAAKPLDTGDSGWIPAAAVAPTPDVQQSSARLRVAPRAEDLPRTVSLTVAYCVYLE